MDNKYVFIIIISLVLFFSSIIGNAAKNNESQNSIIKAKSIAENLTDLNIPLHIVLAIDSSASMYYENESAKSAAIEFLKAIENKTDERIKIGYVSWRHVPVLSSNNLTSNFTDINYKISNINFTGNTCFRIGINRSFDLLRNEKASGIYNVLVIISDGVENCNTGANFTCEEFQKINSTDIYIYTIQIGESDKGSSLLRCLGKPIQKPLPIPNLPGNKTTEPSRLILVDSLFETPIQIQVRGSEIEGRDPNTNMTVSKSITDGHFGPHIVLKLAAPGIQEIKTGIVIAVDSSGSLGMGGRAEYGNNIRESMPKILRNIEEKMPNSNVSIVSWDDNIDFAYSPILNNKSENATSVPISQAIKEITDNEIFLYKNIYPFSLDYFSRLFSSKYPEKYYYCKETEATDLNVGLESARAILNKAIQNRLDATRKLILFITARSEFSPCKPETVYKAKKENCNIHTIGIGVIEGSELENELIKMSGDKNHTEGDKEKYHYSPGSSVFDCTTVASAAAQALKQYNTENISNNIRIVDTLYPYLHINEQSVEVIKNGDILNNSLITKNIRANPDRTNTVEVIINKSVYMKPSDVIQVSFDTYLDLSIPADVTNSRTSRVYSIDRNTPASFISYSWLGNDHIYNAYLPEGSVVID